MPSARAGPRLPSRCAATWRAPNWPGCAAARRRGPASRRRASPRPPRSSRAGPRPRRARATCRCRWGRNVWGRRASSCATSTSRGPTARPVLRGVVAAARAGRPHRHRRPQRCRQVDAARSGRRSPAAHRRHGRTGRPRSRSGYYDQLGRDLDLTQRVREAIAGDKGEPSLADVTLMRRFWFDGDAQFAPIGTLSGGERRRLQLLLTLVQQPNVLLLDEPTNDLDLDTLRALEDLLDDWPGIAVVVSHDRAFLDRTVDQLLALDGDGGIRAVRGGVAAWLAERTAAASYAAPSRPRAAVGARGRTAAVRSPRPAGVRRPCGGCSARPSEQSRRRPPPATHWSPSSRRPPTTASSRRSAPSSRQRSPPWIRPRRPGSSSPTKPRPRASADPGTAGSRSARRGSPRVGRVAGASVSAHRGSAALDADVEQASPPTQRRGASVSGRGDG